MSFLPAVSTPLNERQVPNGPLAVGRATNLLVRIGAAISLCGLLTGCGSTSQPAEPSTLKNALVSYAIDPNVGVSLYDDTYAITTNGSDWTVAWIGDDATHEFSGYVAVGGTISNVTADGLFGGDYVEQTDWNLLEFDAQTDYSNVQSITFTSDTIPVRFYLYIDGVPAVYQVVYSSGGIESTTDDVPFDLTPAGFLRIRSVGTGPMAAVRRAPSFSRPATGALGPRKSVSVGTTRLVKRLEAPALRSSGEPIAR